jgi:predicted enzyme related to lactoylglutathione lyase
MMSADLAAEKGRAMFERLDAVAIQLRDWEGGLAWYGETLDFVPFHIEMEHQFAVLGLPGGGAVIHLVGHSAEPSGGRCVPMISVSDFDAALARLRSTGVAIVEVIDDSEDGYRLARIADPEGNRIGVYAM